MTAPLTARELDMLELLHQGNGSSITTNETVRRLLAMARDGARMTASTAFHARYSEWATAEQVAALIDEGARSRRQGTVCPYAGNTLRFYLHSVGWVREDLRLALMRADFSYCYSQQTPEDEP